jgi:hypothetical protein
MTGYDAATDNAKHPPHDLGTMALVTNSILILYADKKTDSRFIILNASHNLTTLIGK